jgi:hypothetical protein
MTMTMLDTRPAIEAPPVQTATIHVLRIFDHSGTAPITWDPCNLSQVGVARKRFDELHGSGFLTYRTDERGQNEEAIHMFEPHAPMIVAHPPLVGG